MVERMSLLRNSVAGNRRLRSPVSPAASKFTACLSATAAALCCVSNLYTQALVVVQTPIRAARMISHIGGASSTPWRRGFGDARHAYVAAATTNSFDNVLKVDHSANSPARRGASRAFGTGGQLQCKRGIWENRERTCSIGIWDLQTEEDWRFEEKAQKLERKIHSMVNQEQYVVAAKMHSESFKMYVDDGAEVLATNSHFYNAFTTKDAKKMASLWLPSDDVMCIHPGDMAVVGHAAVTSSWASLFNVDEKQFCGCTITPTTVTLRVKGTTAVIRCIQRVTAPESTVPSLDECLNAQPSADVKALCDAHITNTPFIPRPGSFIVTNIFRKARGRWFIVHHHASVPPLPSRTWKHGHEGMAARAKENLEGLLRSQTLGEKLVNPDGGSIHNGLDEANNHTDEYREDTSAPVYDLRSPGNKEAEEVMLSKKTVEALCMLGKENKLGKNEQRRLIKDIIEHVGAQEISAVEVAYEILVGQDESENMENGPQSDADRMMDFVDQAKIIASSLFEKDRQIKNNT